MPPEGAPTSSAVLRMADELVSSASARGLTLRLIGSLAVRVHCPKLGSILEAMGRPAYRDVDLVGLSGQHKQIVQLFTEFGYEADPVLLASQEYGIGRLIFTGPYATHPKVDVFLDALPMSHRLDLRDRLALDSPTVPLADLLLSKLQIHELTEKDIQDVIILVAEHNLDAGNDETIDTAYVLATLRGDWGFYTEAVANARAVLDFAARDTVLAIQHRRSLESKLRYLLTLLESEPKTTRWKMRALLGTRVPWYEEVPDAER